MEQDKSWWPRWNQSVNVFFIFIFIFINVFFIFFANRVTWRLSVQADCHGVFQWPEDRHAAGLQILSPAVTLVSTWDQIKSVPPACHYLLNRAANDPWVLQSRRRPLLGPFPGWNRLVPSRPQSNRCVSHPKLEEWRPQSFPHPLLRFHI